MPLLLTFLFWIPFAHALEPEGGPSPVWLSPGHIAMRPLASLSSAQAITRHLAHVEYVLRQGAAPSAELGKTRAHLLDALHTYWQVGIYPHNAGVPGRKRRVLLARQFEGGPDAVPIFIDEHGHPCAVAQLMLTAGAEPLARRIVATDNTGYLAEMEVSGLAEWVAGSGFSVDDLAWIQPSYQSTPWPRFSGTCELRRLRGMRDEHDNMGGRQPLPRAYQDCLGGLLLASSDPREQREILSFLTELALPPDSPAPWEVALVAQLTPPRWEWGLVELRYLSALERLPGRRADAAALIAVLGPFFEEQREFADPTRDYDVLREWCNLRRPECQGAVEGRPEDCAALAAACRDDVEAWHLSVLRGEPRVSVPGEVRPPLPALSPTPPPTPPAPAPPPPPRWSAWWYLRAASLTALVALWVIRSKRGGDRTGPAGGPPRDG